ncbi:hypothetical protein E2C01_015282 [Portunus trituberculatus]|uniref:Uncharacterized protein n=1 Tax=Portunus trituberculatus TaxID=210409 RepID=A0A5B7DKX6_PORTR|nr:hypothetical protein [Portunus trituberculatus]
MCEVESAAWRDGIAPPRYKERLLGWTHVLAASHDAAATHTSPSNMQQGLAADGTLVHAVPTHLAGAVTTEEYHVLQTVKTHWAHRLRINGNENMWESSPCWQS